MGLRSMIDLWRGYRPYVPVNYLCIFGRALSTICQWQCISSVGFVSKYHALVLVLYMEQQTDGSIKLLVARKACVSSYNGFMYISKETVVISNLSPRYSCMIRNYNTIHVCAVGLLHHTRNIFILSQIKHPGT